MCQRNKICESTSPWAENRAKRGDLLIIKNDPEPQSWEPRLLVLGNDSERQRFQGKHRHLYLKPKPEPCLPTPKAKRCMEAVTLHTSIGFIFSISHSKPPLKFIYPYLLSLQLSVSLESLWRRGGKGICPDSIYSINQDRLGYASVTNNLKVLVI